MRKGCGYALVALVAGLALGVGLLARRVDLGKALDDADRAARDYRAQGLPWTAADVVPPPVPEAQNAATLLRRAVDAGLFVSRSRDAVWRPASFSGDVPLATLAHDGPSLALLHEAVKRPRLDFGRDPDLGLGLRYREHSPLTRLAYVLALRARARAMAGDDAGALADLEDARRLGALLSQEPWMNAAFASESCLGYAQWAAEGCVASTAASPARLEPYRRWLARPLPPVDFVRAWRGEIYVALATARNLSREQVAGFLMPRLFRNPWRVPARTPTLREGLPDDPLARAFTARCLRANADLAAATHGLRDPLATLAGRSYALRSSLRKDGGLSHALDDLLFPTYRHLEGWTRRLVAQRAVGLAYADALTLHARTGRWPPTISAPDPMGAGPLRVRADGDGFRVWSVGRNGRDEGGLDWRESRVARGPYSDDVVAVYPPFRSARP